MNDKKLKEAIEWARDAGRGLTTCYLEMPQKLLLLANAAERSLAVDAEFSERITIGSLQAHIEQLREQLREAESQTVDDAEVREKDNMCVGMGCIDLLIRGPDNEAAWQAVEAAALTPRTSWYTPEVDGPPTDTSKHVLWDVGLGNVALWVKGHWAIGRRLPPIAKAYTYIDPPPVEEPLPKCWCGGEMKPDLVTIEDEDRWAMVCQECSIVGPSSSADSEAEARENWRKMRGQG